VGTLLLVVRAGLLLSSLQRVLAVPRGFAAEHVLALNIRVSSGTYRTREQLQSFYQRLLDAAAATTYRSYRRASPAIYPWRTSGTRSTLSARTRRGWPPSARLPSRISPTGFAPATDISGRSGIPLRAGRFFRDDRRARVGRDGQRDGGSTILAR